MKSVYLHNYQGDVCSLCGEPGILTREHKIKASAIREMFGVTRLYIGNTGPERRKAKYAQGPKSNNLKFNSRICEACNSERTQPSDREFDKLNEKVQKLIEVGIDPMSVFANNDRYIENQEPYLNIFRYFAKLLSCHMAEINAPRPHRLTEFAIGRRTQNCIWLWIKEDWSYKNIESLIGPQQYTAHGGLVVYGSKTTGAATGFHSTLTVGAAQYVFYINLLGEEIREIEIEYPLFFEWCKSKVAHNGDNPFTPEEKLSLGLA